MDKERDGSMSEEESAAVETSRRSVLAVVSGIVGVAAFFLPVGLLAVILGHIGLWRIGRSEGRLEGRGLCIFALVMGYLTVAWTVYMVSQRI